MNYVAPFLHAALAVGLVVALTRMAGLRSLSKMTGFDFVTTVAIGSLLAVAVTSTGEPFVIALLAMAALFAIQEGLAFARTRTLAFEDVIDNSPLLLMEEGRILSENLTAANLIESDLLAKLRAANVLDMRRVRAVVLETTGDISVLHGDPDVELSEPLLRGIRRK